MTLSDGQPLTHYEILGSLGAGGMGEVYRARDTRLEREVAIKRILPSYSEDDGFVTMFKDEAKIAAQLDHPNIVKVFDFDEVEGDYYIAMELVRGTDLKRLIEAADKHVVFHTDDGPIRARRTLAEVERLLDPRAFRRVHRCNIVALRQVVALEQTAGGAPFLKLDDGTRVVVSRSRLASVRALLR